jgi:muramoyltetrapeptide carboxypeptidase
MKELMPLLKSGDEIRIVSSARKISRDDLSDSISFLEANGFKVSLGKNLFEADHQFAGTDEQRLEDLQNALDDTSVKAIWMARGGYGTHRIIDRLSFEVFKNAPKWLLGYSDITVLHAAINRLELPSLHATMPINFKDQSKGSFEKMIEVLKGSKLSYSISKHPFNLFGNVEGRVVGGNLSILYSLTGTPYLPNFKNTILFIEDLDEYLYHIDRMMMNFKLAGILDELGGIIVGGMSDMNDNTIPFGKNALEIIREHVVDLKIPVCFAFPAGHQKENYPLILGRKASLKVGNEGVKINY